MFFYNPNYAAVYILLALPPVLYAVLHLRSSWEKAASAMTAALLLINLWGTRSKTGILTVFLLFFGCVLLLLRTGRKRVLFLTGTVCCLAAYLAVGKMLPGNSFGEKILENAMPEQKHYRLQEVRPGQDEVTILYNNETYCMKLESDGNKTWFSITDEKGQPYELVRREEDGRFKLKEKSYKTLSFEAYRYGEEYHLIMYQKNIPWEFVKKNQDSPYTYVTLFGKEDIPLNAPYAFGKGYERAFSDRFYLWSRTVPLLKKYMLWGSGPNTFALVFPQNDYVTRANIGLDMMTQIISRPHSLYLQTAVQTGFLSLILFMIMTGQYVYQAARMLKGQENRAHQCSSIFQNAPFLLSVSAYLIMGVVNDSLVVTAPIFWALFGAGYGLFQKTDQMYINSKSRQ